MLHCTNYSRPQRLSRVESQAVRLSVRNLGNYNAKFQKFGLVKCDLTCCLACASLFGIFLVLFSCVDRNKGCLAFLKTFLHALKLFDYFQIVWDLLKLPDMFLVVTWRI